MNIGEKIRSLRVAKLMTQSELAGSQITRNMLSSIENGNAQPSLSTILYIAARLNVPVGFLLAEEGDEMMYRKMNNLGNILSAYRAKDYPGCRSLCFSSCPEPDDEIRLLIANCDMEIAADAFWSGKLRFACRYFDEALEYAERSVYPMPHVPATVAVYFRYLQRISPTLYSEVLDESEPRDLIASTPFSRYVDALEALDAEDPALAYAFGENGGETNGFFAEHLAIRCKMHEGKYAEARERLLSLLQADEPLNEISLYAVLCDLEVTCRETEDFKGAYRYTNEKVQLLEQLLKED